MLLKLNVTYLNAIFKRNINLSSVLNRRPPPKEEFKYNPFGKRRKTLDPFDRRWRWTPKLAEPYNIAGGNIEWAKLPFLRRGVQIPGYIDKNTDKFIFVPEMVPEIIVPDLNGCNLKPYVSYNVEDINEPAFTAKKLFEESYEKRLRLRYQEEIEKKESSKIASQNETQQ